MSKVRANMHNRFELIELIANNNSFTSKQFECIYRNNMNGKFG